MHKNLCGCTHAEIAALFAGLDPPVPPLRAVQVYRWIRGGAASFDVMSNLDSAVRRQLAGQFSLRTWTLAAAVRAGDGTENLRLQTGGGDCIEAVILHDGGGRHTACLSTQLGCAMGCVFCKTGQLGLARNLDAAEIIEQYYLINERLAAHGQNEVANIVFMGMGEPFQNMAALRQVCAILSGADCAGTGRARSGRTCFSKKRITVSTCGLAGKICDFAREGPDIRLAVSLHSARQELRRRLMPAASPLAELKDALLFYQQMCARRITLEVVLFDGVNMGREDAAALAVFAGGLDVFVNLIPWNPVEGLVLDGKALASPSRPAVLSFQRLLEARGLTTAVRAKKGGSVSGACGQLG
jgi:23S rRNA (adenine2503-C2)-methyltransferase